MADNFLYTVNLRGYRLEDFTFTVKLASSIVAADVGKALTWDTSAPNQMKLAGADDKVIARLDTFEDRVIEGIKVGTAEFKFLNVLPIQSGETVTVGQTVVGGAAGAVKAAVSPDYTDNYVAEIVGTNAVVVKL